MRNSTRLLYSKLQAAMAQSNQISDATKKFAVSAPIETKLNDAIQASSAFLQLITILPVTDSSGQALTMGLSGLLAKRTNTDVNDRTPTMHGGPDGTEWATKLTEFDVGISYQLLDLWARYPDFMQRYMKAVYETIALDRITIGWYGESAATETNPVANPLGQDVNVGWLKLLETQNPSNYMVSGKVANEISIGSAAGVDYANLDVLVADLFSGIPVEHRTGNEVAIVGSSLVAHDTNKVLTLHAQQPTEKQVGITTLSKSYGGLTTLQVPRFPDSGVFVGDPAHLHLYWQEGSTRRQTDEESKRNRIVDYISSNDAYAIGDKKAVAAVKADNVVINDA